MTEKASAAPEMAAEEAGLERQDGKPGAEPEPRTDPDPDLVSGFSL